MRTLSATLLAAQKGLGVTGGVYDPIWKIVLSRSGQTTRGYDITRVFQIQHDEEEDNGVAEVLLDNTDAALTSLNFEMFQGIIYYGYNTGISRTAWAANTVYAVGNIVKPTAANGYQYRCTVAGTSHATTQPTWGTALGVTQTDGTVTWEMDGNLGDEYSPTAPLKVEGQEFISSQTQLLCRLYLTGIPNQMRSDKAESTHKQEATDTNTCKTLITAVAGATLSPYTNYTAYTVTYDSEDSIIDDFVPADYFSVSINDNRDEKVQELLNYTGCKRRAEDDGEIHVFDPVTTGTTYAYEYRLDVATYHTFFSKNLRYRFVNPNKEVVKAHPDYEPEFQFSGSATSATSYALSPKTHTTYRRLKSSAQATLIAEAIIERNELNAEIGSAVVPMNCGQEVFDYIKITDSSENDSRVGNVQYIQRRCRVATETSDGAYEMTIRFGKINSQSIGEFGTLGMSQGVSKDLLSMIYQLIDDVTELYSNMNDLIDSHNSLVEKHNALTDYLIPGTDVNFKKLTVEEQMIIPTWSLT